MSGKIVQVVARVTAKSEKASEVASILRELVGPTRKETGCVSYRLFQNNSDPADFVFIEEWASDAAIDAHLGMAHLHAAIGKAMPHLTKAPDICRFSLLE
jgi:quinol monooxygenase YgiN